MNQFTSYHEAIQYLEGLSNLPLNGDYMIDTRHLGLYLKRMRYFLNLIGNPDQDIKFIHITGTAGKGTVTNMVHEILNVSGKRVGSFTSPFVTTSIEKIKVGDLYIAPKEFANIVDHLKPHIDRAYIHGPYGRASYFEIFLAIALIYFKKQRCEWVVLEVGLGGRYDATNVIKNPVITTITNIDYDHTEILGKTLNKIARDKAGIIKKGSVFFTAEQRPRLTNMFKGICKDEKAFFNNISRQESVDAYNRALATAISKEIGIKERFIIEGIKKAKLQCRFETIQVKPLVIVDGAHNRAKMASTVSNLEKIARKKLHLIIGMAENKDYDSLLSQIIPCADSVTITRTQTKDRKCAHPKELLEISKRYVRKNVSMRTYLDPNQALKEVLKKAHKNDAVIITGSFFLAGELRKHWVPEETILQKRKID